MTTLALSRRHADVLWIVSEYGPITAGEVGSHLLMPDSTARSALRSLEAKRLIDATYTDLRAGRRGRGYVITARGEAIAAEPQEDQ